ncbi:hypothetical protein OJAV_G00033930 [Oryzias javanicus]|uniref:Uncharacterized protein n=1 Tax=Oryzias javanicus TaxID=123683 RepID=A0A3S2PYY0_ORYJA|nr:hypothetical protein OJAV_G00033930 [Oryzias javanicus]
MEGSRGDNHPHGGAAAPITGQFQVISSELPSQEQTGGPREIGADCHQIERRLYQKRLRADLCCPDQHPGPGLRDLSSD